MKKKILFVINTLGRAGAETAMLELLRKLPPERYEVSLYVVLEQGELVHELPDYVALKNTRYRDSSVLSAEGKRALMKTLFRSFFRNGRMLKKTGDIFQNLADMRKGSGIKPDKLLWRMVSDGGERLNETYDLAIAYLEGGAAYYVA